MAAREGDAHDGGRRLRVLFFLRAINFDRVFDALLRELLGAGHQIHVVLAADKKTLPDGAGVLFERLAAEFAGSFSYERRTFLSKRWQPLAEGLRYSIDYLRYLEPAYRDATALRARAQERAPQALRRLDGSAVLRLRALRRLAGALLRGIEAGVPPPPELLAYLRERRPDVVLVSPLVGLGSAQGEAVRAAASLGIPTVLPVASWDNLTNKGVIRDAPTLTVVWNEAQVDEAVALHGLPRPAVTAVGAHSFDHWFAWRPSTTREEFGRLVGLDLERPLVLYVGSSSFIAGREASFVAEWLARLRADERLRDVAVLVRPHPQNVASWAEADLDEPGRTAVYPRGGAIPTDERRKAEYYDSLHHAGAVVGVNTSALIEAAIVRRPVLTLADGRFHATQGGTLHFAHLAGGGDGVLVTARTWEEHLDGIAAALAEPELHRERIERFLREFVRPRGLDRAAAPLAAAAVERAAAQPVAALRPGPAARAAASALALAAQLGDERRRRELAKALRRRRRRVRRGVARRVRHLAGRA